MNKLQKEKETLKKWEQELKELQIAIPGVKESVAGNQKELSGMLSRELVLKERIHLGHLNQPEITDHAIVQYLTRVMHIDIDEVKDNILTPEVLHQIETLGPNGKYATKTLQLVVRNNKVITVYDPNTKKDN